MKKIITNWIKFWNLKTVVVTRMASWIALTSIVPILLINNRYGLWEYKDDGLSFNGWGIVCVLIIVVVIYALINYAIEALEYSFLVQILKGIKFPIILLLFAYWIVDVMGNNIMNIQWILKWTILSESLAMLINPFPRLVHKYKVKKHLKEMREAGAKI